MNQGRVTHPYQLLGIANERIGPFGLLGVSPDGCTPAVVRQALQVQLARVNSHPLSNTVEAEALREELRAAAEMLSDPKTLEELRNEFHRQVHPNRPDHTLPSRPGSAPTAHSGTTVAGSHRPEPSRSRTHSSSSIGTQGAPGRPAGSRLSSVDQELVMAIVSSGGWNSRARRRAVAIASRHELDVSELAKSLVRVGSTPIAPRSPEPPPARQPENGVERERVIPPIPDDEAPDALRRISPEEAESERRAVRSLTVAAIAFVIGAVIIIPFGLYVLREIASIPEKPGMTRVSDQPPRPEVNNLRTNADPSTGEVAPSLARDAGALSEAVVPELEEVAQALSISAGLDDDLLAKFRTITTWAGTHWVRLDTGGRTAIHSTVVSAIYEKGTEPEDARLLIDAIDPPAGALEDADDVWSWIWSKATLAAIASEPQAPGAASRLIDTRVRQALGGVPERPALSFDTAAPAALREIVARLIDSVSVVNDPVSVWLAWIDGVSAVLDGADRDEMLLSAAYELMIDGPDLQASDAARSAAAALFQSIDWRRSSEARRRALAWYDEPRIASTDLTILSAYLVTSDAAPGLDDTFILPAAATSAVRSRERDRLARAWRVGDAARAVAPTGVASADLEDWFAASDRALRERVSATHDEMLSQLIRLAQLNQAAYLLDTGRPSQARFVLEEGMVQLASAIAAGSTRSRRAADVDIRQPDGEWATEFTRLDRINDREGQVRALERLLTETDTDLGPADAGVLVQAALNSGPRSVRMKALEVIEATYDRGPNVLLVFADQIPPDREDAALSQTIARITGRSLPDPQSPGWYSTARLALLQRILQLRGAAPGNERTDIMASVLAEHYLARSNDTSATGSISNDDADAALGAAAATLPTLSPFEAARRCCERWFELARPMAPIAPIPGSLDDIRRRLSARLALYDDPIGSFAAAQLGVLETAVYATAAERPAARSQLLAILEMTTRARGGAASVFEQTIATEKAILEVWRIRLETQRGSA